MLLSFPDWLFLCQEGYTALISAAEYGHVDVVQWLIDNGADIEDQEDEVCDNGFLFF